MIFYPAASNYRCFCDSPKSSPVRFVKMNQSFRSAMKEFDYKGEHLAVFPMKVNQRRQVIEAYLEEASKYHYGLEAGSKPELYAAIALDQSPDSLLVCNGFKDDSFLDLAFVGARAGKNVVIVIEKLNELGKVVDRALETGIRPMVGMRVRLYTRGSGRWEKSGGEQSKFGLTTTELLQAIKMLRDAGMVGYACACSISISVRRSPRSNASRRASKKRRACIRQNSQDGR